MGNEHLNESTETFNKSISSISCDPNSIFFKSLREICDMNDTAYKNPLLRFMKFVSAYKAHYTLISDLGSYLI